ncbi:MAG: TIGR01841 family phasin [Pseudomonadota bacterium]
MADPKNPFLDMFQSFGEQMKIPGPDVAQIMEAHRKNLQALQDAATIGAESAQAVAAKQQAAMTQALSDIAESMQQVVATPDATGGMASSMDLANRSFVMTLANASEIGEIMQKGNMDALGVLRDRMIESLEELAGASTAKPTKKK